MVNRKCVVGKKDIGSYLTDIATFEQMKKLHLLDGARKMMHTKHAKKEEDGAANTLLRQKLWNVFKYKHFTSQDRCI